MMEKIKIFFLKLIPGRITFSLTSLYWSKILDSYKYYLDYINDLIDEDDWDEAEFMLDFVFRKYIEIRESRKLHKEFLELENRWHLLYSQFIFLNPEEIEND